MIVDFISLALISVNVLGKIFPVLAVKIETLQGGRILDTRELESDSPVDYGAMGEDPSQFDYRSFLKIMLWFSGYFLSIVIFLLFFLKFFSDCHWKTSIQITAGVALVSWVVFTLVPDVPWLGGIER